MTRTGAPAHLMIRIVHWIQHDAAPIDDAYGRTGTATRVLGVEPRAGRRHVQVTAPRTPPDWAHGIRHHGDRHSPTAPYLTARIARDRPESATSGTATTPPRRRVCWSWTTARPLSPPPSTRR